MIDLTSTLNTACIHANTGYQPEKWLQFIDTLVTENALEYSSNDDDDAWINVMNKEGNQVFFCGRDYPVIFIVEAFKLEGLNKYGKEKEVVLVKDWWSAVYTIDINELTGNCVVWHAAEIAPGEPFSLLDFVYATH